MTLFLGIHKVPQEAQESEIIEGYNQYKQSAQSMGLKPLGAVYSMEKGFAYCQTEANSAEEVRKAHENVQIPLEDAVEIQTLN